MTRRPFLAGQVGALADEPLDPSRVAVRVARITLEEAPAVTVHVETPTLEDGRVPPRPSRVLLADPSRAPLDVPARAAFEHDGSSLRARVLFDEPVSFYGAGMVPGPLLRNRREVTFWNSDAWCYGEETPALYQSHPFVLALLPDGSAVGLLADLVGKGAARIGSDGVEFVGEGPPFELFVLAAAGPDAVLEALGALLGRIALPPLWALGYHQCRWSYASADEFRELARQFRQRGIPCDALWFDIDYMDRRRVFRWNPTTFPDPAGLIAELSAQGFRTVAILDPGIAVGDELFEEGRAGGHFVEDGSGRPVLGRVWPGVCAFPDFLGAGARAWWSAKVAAFLRASGLDGLWTDMNEPSVFRSPARTLPEDALHAGGECHRDVHNLYGQRMAEATRAGFVDAYPERRPFVLTRSNHLGGARTAATWTGDNQSRWEDLRWSITMILSLSLSGQPFAGPDVGGFYGDPSPELFVRWFELGAFLPFFRGHAEQSSCRKEPWAFGPEVEAHVKRAIERRQRLLPTLYTAFHHAATRGTPIVRPLFVLDPGDPDLRGSDDAFLFGESLLVAPVVEQGANAREVVLPRLAAGPWFGFPDGEVHAGGSRVQVAAPLGTLPLFARAGTLVVEGELRPRAAEGYGDELTLHVFLDDQGEARGTLYEDGGEGTDDSGGWLIEITVRSEGDQRVLEERVQGDDRRPVRARTLRLHQRGKAVVERELGRGVGFAGRY